MSAFHADPANRRNNLTLIRLIAALAVMVSHAWPIVHGPGAAEPLAATGYTLGTFAVMVFFGLSGFLIAASWDRAPRPGRFLARRARRLLPGLWVMLALSALIMGPLVSGLGSVAYLSDAGPWRFLARNGALLPIEPALPGVFETNPYPAAAGSIWTLHYEAVCYLGLMTVGLVGGLTPSRARWILVALVALTLLSAAVGERLHPRLQNLVLLGLPFALGMAAWVWRRRLALAWQVIPALAIVAWLVHGTVLSHLSVSALVVYTTLWAGFVPWKAGQAFSEVDDLSYGLYLYAFPVQGLVQYLAAPGGVILHLAVAVPPTLALAWLSWRWVERPWLRGGTIRWPTWAGARWRRFLSRSRTSSAER